MEWVGLGSFNVVNVQEASQSYRVGDDDAEEMGTSADGIRGLKRRKQRQAGRTEKGRGGGREGKKPCVIMTPMRFVPDRVQRLK